MKKKKLWACEMRDECTALAKEQCHFWYDVSRKHFKEENHDANPEDIMIDCHLFGGYASFGNYFKLKERTYHDNTEIT